MGFRQISSYLPEQFRQISSNLPEQFRQISSYLPEQFRQITSSLKIKKLGFMILLEVFSLYRNNKTSRAEKIKSLRSEDNALKTKFILY